MSEALIPLLTLIALELILGIDNIIFISILADKLPKEQRNKLRFWGLGMAVILRLGLLAVISWVIRLDNTLFTIGTIDFSGKGIILILGGIFLLWKSTKEIYYKTEHAKSDSPITSPKASFKSLLIEIIILDLVFSISVILMLFASKPISEFIQHHPSFKILALSFLMLIGIALIGEGLKFEIPKGYIYFSMAFSFIVNLIQIYTNAEPKSVIKEKI